MSTGYILELPNAILDVDGRWTKTVELDEMTGEEEDILVDQTREEGGTGAYKKTGSSRITEILSRCTVRVGSSTRPVGKDRYQDPLYFEKVWDRAFIADRTFAMVRLRQLSLGPVYTFSKNCPNCKKEIQHISIDLSKLEVQNMSIEDVSTNHEVELPRSRDIVVWKNLTGADEELINATMKEHKEDFVSALLYRRIVGVRPFDNQTQSHGSMAKAPGGLLYVKRMKTADRRFFGNILDTKEGGIDSEIQVVCDGCQVEFTSKLQIMGSDFFFPSAIPSRENSSVARLPSVGDGLPKLSTESPSADAGA